MNLKSDISNIREVAKILLAASTKKTFPDVLLVGGAVTPLGFYYDFIFPFEFQKSFLVLIEEGISSLIKIDPSFKILDMVPFSASELLYFKKEDVRAEIVSKCHDSLVSVIDIEGFVDLLDEPLFTDSLSSAGAVKLRTFEKAGKRGKKDVVRIFGAASYDKQSLKKFLKDEPEIVQRQHTEIVKRLNLLDFDSSGSFSIWRSAGEEFFELIGHFIKKSLQSQGYIRIRLPSPSTLAFLAEQEEEGLHFDLLCERAKLVKQNGLDRSFELATFYDHSLTDFSCGLLKTVESNFILSYSFCKEKQLFEECISSLLFLSKMLKILGFEFDVVVTLRKVKPSALGNRERICADTLKKAVSALEGVSIVEKAHSTFKGAKVEFRVSDALGRNWSTSFMQVFYDEGSDFATVVSSILGSRERIAALLLEKHNGIPFLLLKVLKGM